MEKPKKRTGGKTRPQQIINGAYNQGLDELTAWVVGELEKILAKTNHYGTRLVVDSSRIDNLITKLKPEQSPNEEG